MEMSLGGTGQLGPQLTVLPWACPPLSGLSFPIFLISGLCSVLHRAMAHVRGGEDDVPKSWTSSFSSQMAWGGGRLGGASD